MQAFIYCVPSSANPGRLGDWPLWRRDQFFQAEAELDGRRDAITEPSGLDRGGPVPRQHSDRR
jgi:hypothetical protein